MTRRLSLAWVALAAAGCAAPRIALDDPAKMARFFRDPEMQHIVMIEDFKAFFMGAPYELQQQMKRECHDPAISDRHTELCAYVWKLTLPD